MSPGEAVTTLRRKEEKYKLRITGLSTYEKNENRQTKTRKQRARQTRKMKRTRRRVKAYRESSEHFNRP